MTTSAPEIVFDEELNTYRIKAQPAHTQRKPETGERLAEAPSQPPTGKCYLCRDTDAVIWPACGVPKCAGCHDRFRRKE